MEAIKVACVQRIRGLDREATPTSVRDRRYRRGRRRALLVSRIRSSPHIRPPWPSCAGWAITPGAFALLARGRSKSRARPPTGLGYRRRARVFSSRVNGSTARPGLSTTRCLPRTRRATCAPPPQARPDQHERLSGAGDEAPARARYRLRPDGGLICGELHALARFRSTIGRRGTWLDPDDGTHGRHARHSARGRARSSSSFHFPRASSYPDDSRAGRSRVWTCSAAAAARSSVGRHLSP